MPRPMMDGNSRDLPVSGNANLLPDVDLKLRNASAFDIPFVFNLVLDGSVTGEFSDQHLFGSGHFHLFIWIVKAIVSCPRWIGRRGKLMRLQIICRGNQELGFVQVEQSDPASNSSIVTIHLFAVSKKFRNQGVCTKTVASMIESMPAGTIVIVYCTKYARVMQQILLKLRFKRDKARRDNLAKFIYQKI